MFTLKQETLVYFSVHKKNRNQSCVLLTIGFYQRNLIKYQKKGIKMKQEEAIIDDLEESRICEQWRVLPWSEKLKFLGKELTEYQNKQITSNSI